MLELNQVDATIQIPAAPAIPGLTFRHYRGPEDFAAIASIFNAAARADANNEVATPEMIQEQYTHLNNCDLAQDLSLIHI